MNKVLAIVLILVCHTAGANEYQVIGVADGDTITVLDTNNIQYKIRLSGIDAPESGQPFGQKSKQILSDIVFRQFVSLDCSGKDRYQRLICVVYIDNKDVNYSLVAHGAAWVYRRYYPEGIYYQAENYARENKIGLWSLSEAQKTPPWEWRKRR